MLEMHIASDWKLNLIKICSHLFFGSSAFDVKETKLS